MRPFLGSLLSALSLWLAEAPDNVQLRVLRNRFNLNLANWSRKAKGIVLVEITQIPEQHVALLTFLEGLSLGNKILLRGFRAGISTQNLKTRLAHVIGFIISAFFPKSQGSMARLLGIKGIALPETGTHSKIARDLTANFFSTGPSKRDIENFRVFDVEIGELIYDAFLRSEGVGTVSPDDPIFRDHFERCVALTSAWLSFFQRREVSAFVGSNVYLQAIPQRIAVARGIPTFDVQGNRIHRVTTLKPIFSEFDNLSSAFNQREKISSVNPSPDTERKIQRILKGKGDFSAHIPNSNWLKLTAPSLDNVSSQPVVFVPSLGDSPHTAGKQAFVDVLEWFTFLCGMTKSRNIEMFYKAHPMSPQDCEELRAIARVHPQMVEIPANIRSTAILDQEPSLVLSIRGHIALEAGLRGIPTILAGIRNPYCSFNFAICTETPEQFESQVLAALKVAPNRARLTEQAKYALKVLELSYPESIVIPNYADNVSALKSVGQSAKIYESAAKAITPERMKANLEMILLFLRSQSRRLSPVISE